MKEGQLKSQKRGLLTERIKKRSTQLLGYEISQIELRLLPYIQYVLVNSEQMDINKINSDERDVLAMYVNKGLITNGITECRGRPMINKKIKVTKQFWNYISEIIYLGYVDLH